MKNQVLNGKKPQKVMKTLRAAVFSINTKISINSGFSLQSHLLRKYPASPVCSETVEERRQQEGDLRSCYFLPIFLSVAAILLVTVLTIVLLYWNFSQKELGKFIFQQ